MPTASAREASESPTPNPGEHGIEGFFRAQSLPERPPDEFSSRAESDIIPLPPVKVDDIKSWIDNVNTAKQSEFEQDPLADVYFGIEEYAAKLDCRDKDLINFIIRYHCNSAWDHSEPQIQRLKGYIAEERSKKHAFQAAVGAINADMKRVQSRICACRWWIKSAKITQAHLEISKRVWRSLIFRVGPASTSIKEPGSISKTWVKMKELEIELATARAKSFELRSKVEEDITAMFESVSALARETELES